MLVTLTRRFFAGVMVCALLGGSAQAQTPVKAEDLAKDLAVQSALGDVVQGVETAPVTVIEYASLTCTHCANFHKEVYPHLKAAYIDTGKVRYILREFPFDPLATAGFMLARCEGNERYYPVVDLLFRQQANWAFVQKPLDALTGLMRQAGFSQERFDTCLKDQRLFTAVTDVKTRALDKLGVNATPTFFINGTMKPGELSADELDGLLKPLLKE